MTAVAIDTPHLTFAHLLAMSDEIGTFEHADHTTPRVAHGYCADDMARVLVVAVKEQRPSLAVHALSCVAMRFLVAAQDAGGMTRNRRSVDGQWHGVHGVDDCWGRSVAAFGIAASVGTDPWIRQTGSASFRLAATKRSPSRRTMAFAALGAASMLDVDPDDREARALLVDAVATIGRPCADLAWPWPEARLTYANATVPEALIAAGTALGRPEVTQDGLDLLQWLLTRETHDGHLSPTPAGGAGPEDRAPMFDQQPIEVAAMADACARAEAATGDDTWTRGVELAIAWFLGDNDIQVAMQDHSTGGGYDGLHDRGPNLNQGAESTIVLISTLQHARRRALST